MVAVGANAAAMNLTNTTNQQDLCSLFECPVCFDYVLPPILQVLHKTQYHQEVNINAYSFLFNTSHAVLGDMLDFFQKHVWITRHAIQITQRPG